MISTPTELRDFSLRIRDAEWVALDTEADSLHAYPEKLCLLQIAIPGVEALVDPLADLHLEPLWEALDHRELIFHAADYDLRLLFQGQHFRPTAIFDTMWAARLLGEAHFGLNDILTRFLGITLEKGSQKANWGQRPLTSRMTEYALNDVRHLRPLEQLLRRDLVEKGRLEIHQQICQQLIEACCQPSRQDPNQVWRTKGHDKLSERALGILRELWHWRELDAMRTNRPPFFILKHETLTAIAADAAEGGIGAIRLPPYLTQKRRRELREAVSRGLALEIDQLPKHIKADGRRLTRKELDRAEDLRKLRDERGKEMAIDPTLIAAKATLFALARTDTNEWPNLLPWQREVLSPQKSAVPEESV